MDGNGWEEETSRVTVTCELQWSPRDGNTNTNINKNTNTNSNINKNTNTNSDSI